MAHGCELRGPDVYLHIVRERERKKPIWKVFFKFSQGTCPWMIFAWNLFGVSPPPKKKKKKLWGLWAKSLIGNKIVFRGSEMKGITTVHRKKKKQKQRTSRFSSIQPGTLTTST